MAGQGVSPLSFRFVQFLSLHGRSDRKAGWFLVYEKHHFKGRDWNPVSFTCCFGTVLKRLENDKFLESTDKVIWFCPIFRWKSVIILTDTFLHIKCGMPAKLNTDFFILGRCPLTLWSGKRTSAGQIPFSVYINTGKYLLEREGEWNFEEKTKSTWSSTHGG